MLNKFFIGFAAIAISLTLPAHSQTQSPAFPTRPVTLIVSYPPGGMIDPIFRVMQPHLEKTLGQPVVMENRGGGAGNTGSAIVARAQGDGHTILLTTNAVLTTNPFLFKNMPLDVNKDLAPITTVTQGPLVIAVHKSVPVKNIPELIEYTKKTPDGITYGTAGFGSPFHIAGEYFKQRAGIEMTHVPFNGGGPMAQALAGGHIKMAVSTLATLSGLVQDGSVRLIAVMDPKRLASHPDIQAVSETLPGIEATAWSAIMAPSGTPEPILERLNNAIVGALSDPAIKEKIAATFGQTVMGETRAATAKRIADEQKKWGDVIKQSGIEAK